MNKKTTFNTKKSAFVFFNLMMLSLSGVAQVQFMNGNLSTGATTKSVVAAPAGYTWSELQNDTGVTTSSNTNLGFGAAISGDLSVADDFTVPIGQIWNISKFSFYAYKTGSVATPSPFDDLRVVVHSSNPAAGATTVLFGNLIDNVFDTSSDALMYRIGNSLYPTASAPGITRKIWKIESTPVTLSLPAGTYWIEWRIGDVPATGSFCPASTVVGARTQAGYNAVQFIGTWAALVDAGNPATAADVAVDIPFGVTYTVTLGVDESNFNNVSVYPNPVKNTLNFELKNQDLNIDRFEIYDIKGAKVLSQNISKNETLSVNVSSLNTGAYFVKLLDATGKKVAIKKIVKE